MIYRFLTINGIGCSVGSQTINRQHAYAWHIAHLAQLKEKCNIGRDHTYL